MSKVTSIAISPDTATWSPTYLVGSGTRSLLLLSQQQPIAKHLQGKKVEANLITECHKLNTLSESYFRRLDFAQELSAPSQPLWTTMIHGDVISTADAKD